MAQMHHAIEIPQLEQVGLVVKDLQKSMESMWNSFGIGPWSVYVYPASSLREMTYRGQKGRFGMQVARAKRGAMEMELIQPTEGENSYSDFLKERGDGIHHLGWLIVPNLAETIKAMAQAGFPCLMTGRTYRSRFAYFDTSSVLGTMLEGYEIDES
ncbi:MAG: VOC family protein, partial [Dehalococcoidia bacterium]|nr:VOC family protein [Dehalococcoidia bacterium]